MPCPNDAQASKELSPRVLLPSLRADMMTMKKNTTPVEERPYLLCCVRLSPEKEPERFVELVEELSARGTLQELNLTPYLIGVATTPYAEVKLSLLLLYRCPHRSAAVLERLQ